MDLRLGPRAAHARLAALVDAGQHRDVAPRHVGADHRRRRRPLVVVGRAVDAVLRRAGRELGAGGGGRAAGAGAGRERLDVSLGSVFDLSLSRRRPSSGSPSHLAVQLAALVLSLPLPYLPLALSLSLPLSSLYLDPSP